MMIFIMTLTNENVSSRGRSPRGLIIMQAHKINIHKTLYTLGCLLQKYQTEKQLCPLVTSIEKAIHLLSSSAREF